MVQANPPSQSAQDLAELEKLKLQLEIGDLRKGWTSRPSSWIALATTVIAVSGFVIEMQLNRVQIARADLELQEKSAEIQAKNTEINESQKKLAHARDDLTTAEQSKRAVEQAVRELVNKKRELESKLNELTLAIDEAVKLNTVEEVKERLRAVDFELSSSSLRMQFTPSELEEAERRIAEQIEHILLDRLKFEIGERENVQFQVQLRQVLWGNGILPEERLRVTLKTMDGRTSGDFEFRFRAAWETLESPISTPDKLIDMVAVAIENELDDEQLVEWFVNACTELDIVIHTRNFENTIPQDLTMEPL